MAILRRCDEDAVVVPHYSTSSSTGLPELERIIGGGISPTIVTNIGVSDREYLPMLKFKPEGPSRRSKARKSQNMSILQDENMEDRIRRFPDDILMFIISLLTMREGATTTILSSQWAKLWSTSVSYLNFNDNNVFGYKYPADYFSVKERERAHLRKDRCISSMRASRLLQLRHFKKKGFLECERVKFIRRVNRIWQSILQHQRASPLHALRVKFPLGKESTLHLDKWIKLAVDKGVTQLELDFNFNEFYCLGFGCYDEAYKLPVQGIGSSLSYLRLNFSVFDIPPDFQGFTSLVSLSLHSTLIVNNSLQNILTNCASLERLSLRFCKFSNASLKFVGPSIILKHVDITDCLFLKEIEVQDVNILSFELESRETEISMKNFRRLARLVLNTDRPVEILGEVPHIKTLFFKHRGTVLPKLSVFNNLTWLVFAAEHHKLFDVVFFLEACPLLEQLDLDMGILYRCKGWYTDITEEETRISGIRQCPHNNLNKVIMHSFINHPEQIKLAKYLLDNATVLEKMEIYASYKSYIGSGIWGCGRVIADPKEIHLKHVHEMLQKEAQAHSAAKVILALHD